MSNTKSNNTRRKLLKNVAVGSSAIITAKSLPEAWQKPIVNAIVLPAHAALTDDSSAISTGATTTAAPACCAGVFCTLRFPPRAPISASAQVNSDCTITMSGGSILGSWSGSGTVAADGSFSFNAVVSSFPANIILPPPTTPVPTTPAPPTVNQFLVTGTVSADCSSLSGTIESFGDFVASVTPGITDITQCVR